MRGRGEVISGYNPLWCVWAVSGETWSLGCVGDMGDIGWCEDMWGVFLGEGTWGLVWDDIGTWGGWCEGMCGVVFQIANGLCCQYYVFAIGNVEK